MKKLATDAMFKLEYDGKDQSKKASTTGPDINELEMQQSAWKDDYIINYVLRKNLRVSDVGNAIERGSHRFFSRKPNGKIVSRKKRTIVSERKPRSIFLSYLPADKMSVSPNSIDSKHYDVSRSENECSSFNCLSRHSSCGANWSRPTRSHRASASPSGYIINAIGN